jgi:hypothetical protein
MALYLGEDKVKINLNGIAYCLNLFSTVPITNGVLLLSSDDYILQDFNGIYLIPNDSPAVNTGTVKLLLPDGCALKESTGLYLVYKEDE